jgi:predicted nucleic-acid-binding Zn-ribbon protein
MNAVPWICPACKAKVPSGAASCEKCGCPESATAEVVDDHQRQQASKIGNPARVRCLKCSGDMTVRGELRGSAGGISAAFELSNARFRYVSCARCGYTEFYRSEVSGLGQLADLFTG